AEQAKARAAEEGRTFTSLVAEGLRTVLETEPVPRDLPSLPRYGTPGGKVLVDLSENAALRDLLDAEDGW
ncbi:MAG: CopG family transcriptional regulator, partial [Solirubrobacteraceae bacterium]